MFLIQKFDGILIGCKEGSFKNENGQDTPFYQVSIEVDEATAVFSCDKKLGEKIKCGEFPKYSRQTFVTEFNTSAEPKNRKIRVLDILNSPTKK